MMCSFTYLFESFLIFETVEILIDLILLLYSDDNKRRKEILILRIIKVVIISNYFVS